MDEEDPTERRLLEKYEKYPEYLKISFKKPESFFENTKPFTASNKEAIKILSNKSRETILSQAFPLSFYVQLVPELNVLTISVAKNNELMSTDALLTDLISFDD